jgi:hypothetical protein
MSVELLPRSPQEHKPRRARRLGWMAVVAVAAIVGTGVSWAAIPHSASQLITACYDNSGPQKGVLRVIDEQGGAACTAGETKIRWSGKGLQWAGKWANSRTYYANDVVRYKDGLFVARVGSLGVAPDTDAAKWAVMVDPPLRYRFTGRITVQTDPTLDIALPDGSYRMQGVLMLNSAGSSGGTPPYYVFCRVSSAFAPAIGERAFFERLESRSFVGRVEVSGGQITDFVSCIFGTFATSASLDYEFLFDRVG